MTLRQPFLRESALVCRIMGLIQYQLLMHLQSQQHLGKLLLVSSGEVFLLALLYTNKVVLPQHVSFRELSKTSEVKMQTPVLIAKNQPLQLPRLVKSNLTELHPAPLLFPKQCMLYQQSRVSEIG